MSKGGQGTLAGCTADGRRRHGYLEKKGGCRFASFKLLSVPVGAFEQGGESGYGDSDVNARPGSGRRVRRRPVTLEAAGPRVIVPRPAAAAQAWYRTVRLGGAGPQLGTTSMLVGPSSSPASPSPTATDHDARLGEAPSP